MMTSKYGPCSFADMDHDALVWYLVCKEGLCSDCKEYHTALKVLKSHEMIPYGILESYHTLHKIFEKHVGNMTEV